MKILLATDFSEPARHATDLAAALARRLGDQLVLVFVVEPTVVTTPDFMVDVDAIERAVEERAKARLDEDSKRLRASGVDVTTRIERGVVADAVTRLASELEPRLVLVGTHGRRAVSRFFLGSAADRIVREVNRPVLVVRSAGDERLRAWAEEKRPLHVAVGLEMTGAGKHAVNWVRALREAVACDVTFVHFYWPPEEVSRLGLQGTTDMLAPDPATVAVIERDLRAFVGELPGTGKVAYRVQPNWGEIGSHLAMVAEELASDLLVLGSHQRGQFKRLWLGKTTQPTLHAATMPVLCVPESDPRTRPAAESPRMRNVVVATDLSSLGDAAVPYAYSIAEKGGHVDIVYVHERHLPNPLYAYEDTRGSIKGTELETKLLERLRALIPPSAAKHDISTDVMVIDGGYPPMAIVQTANRIGADAICLASHGRSGLGKAVLGSVASVIVDGADRPVFVVRGRHP